MPTSWTRSQSAVLNKERAIEKYARTPAEPPDPVAISGGKGQLRGFGLRPKRTLSRWTILGGMDHVEVLRAKIGRLRLEIAEIQKLNTQYRLQGKNGEEAHVVHGQRQERLLAIQQELIQLANLGHKLVSVEEMKEKHRSRLHLVRRAS